MGVGRLGKGGTVALPGTQKRGKDVETCWLFYPRPPLQVFDGHLLKKYISAEG